MLYFIMILTSFCLLCLCNNEDAFDFIQFIYWFIDCHNAARLYYANNKYVNMYIFTNM